MRRCAARAPWRTKPYGHARRGSAISWPPHGCAEPPAPPVPSVTIAEITALAPAALADRHDGRPQSLSIIKLAVSVSNGKAFVLIPPRAPPLAMSLSQRERGGHGDSTFFELTLAGRAFRARDAWVFSARPRVACRSEWPRSDTSVTACNGERVAPAAKWVPKSVPVGGGS